MKLLKINIIVSPVMSSLQLDLLFMVFFFFLTLISLIA